MSSFMKRTFFFKAHRNFIGTLRNLRYTGACSVSVGSHVELLIRGQRILLIIIVNYLSHNAVSVVSKQIENCGK